MKNVFVSLLLLGTFSTYAQATEVAADKSLPKFEAMTQTSVGLRIPADVILQMAKHYPHQSTMVSKRCEHTTPLYSVDFSKAKEGASADELMARGLQLKIDGTNQAALAGMDYLLMVSPDAKTKQHRTLLAQPVKEGEKPLRFLADQDTTELLEKSFPALNYTCELSLYSSDEEAVKVADEVSKMLGKDFRLGGEVKKTYESAELALVEHQRIVQATRTIHSPSRTVYWIQYLRSTPAYNLTTSWDSESGVGVHLVTNLVDGEWTSFLAFAEVK